MKHLSRIILLGLTLSLVSIVIFYTAIGAKLELYGNWIITSNYDGSILYDEYPSSISFSRNGKGTIDGMSMTWKVDDDRLIIAGAWGTIDYYYTVQNSILHLGSKPYDVVFSDMRYKKT